MKKINDVINNANSSDIINKYQCKDDNKEATIDIVNWLFAEIKDIIPAFFINVTSEDHLNGIKRQWLEAIQRHGINSEQKLKRGLESLVDGNYSFLPPVMTFIQGCSPSAESLGLPSLQKAYEEACRLAPPYVKQRNWSHDVVFHAAQETGLYFLSSNSKDVSYPVFKYNYELAINMLMNGDKLRVIPKAITKKNHIVVGGIEFELIGRNAMSNIINYQVAGGSLNFSEFDKLFTQALSA